MIKLLLNSTVTLIVVLISFSAHSSTMIDVHGTQYEVEVVEETAVNLMDQLSGQVWWNDPVLAKDFANALYDAYAFPNFSNTAGPIFAYDYNSDTNNVDAFICDAFSPAHDCAFEFINLPANSTNFFSKATVVPVPAAVWLFATALLGFAGLAKRR